MRAHYSLLPATSIRAAWLHCTFISLLISGWAQHEAYAAQVTLRWDYHASGAAGFMLYCGNSSRTYSTRLDVGNTETFTIGTLQEGKTSFCAVTAYDPGKIESKYSNEITVWVPYPAPIAKFSASPTSGTAPLNVAFDNNSTGQVNSWAWDFGDGTASSSHSPTHRYSTPGTYTVTLTATGTGGSRTASTSISISASASSSQADLNTDGVINSLDLAIFWQLLATNDPAADINGDGAINVLDVSILMGLLD
jgi:PKD repeat protein